MKALRLAALALVCTAALMCLENSARAQNLVTNGDFEGSWESLGPSGWVAAGWTNWDLPLPPTQFAVSGHTFFWNMPGNDGVHHSGVNNYQRFIGGTITGVAANFRGGVYQVVSTTPGATYDMDLDVRVGSGDFALNVNKIEGYYGYDLTGQTSDPAASSIVWTNKYALPYTDMWNHYSSRFTATGSAVSVWLKATVPDDGWGYVDADNVVVAPSGGTSLLTITSGPTASRLSDTSYEIDWTTDSPGNSIVQYDTTPPNSDAGIVYTQTTSQSTLGTTHAVVLAGLQANVVYHFRVSSAAAGFKQVYSGDQVFHTPGPAVPNFANGDFEIIQHSSPNPPSPDGNQTAPPWVSFPEVGDSAFPSGVVGPYPSNKLGNWYSVRAQSGSYFVGAVASYGTKNGGFYQRVQAVNGQTYQVSGYIDTVATPQSGTPTPDDDRVWVGIDPNGGVDPNAASIVWNPDAERTGSNVANHYTPTSASATATGNVITVFVRFEQKFPLMWNYTIADNFTLLGPAAQPANVTSVGDAKSRADFAYVTFDNGAVVTLVPISETGFFYVQDPDGTSGIKVETNATPPNVGDLIKLTGSMGTDPDGERVLRDASFTSLGTGTTKVRFVSNGAFGGPGYIAQDGSTLTTGLSNQGLLVQVYGKVTYVDFLNSVWYLDDGSNVNSQAVDDLNNPITGIKVINSGVFPNTGDYVSMVGVVSSEIVNGKQIRVLRGRDGTVASDFNTLAP